MKARATRGNAVFSALAVVMLLTQGARVAAAQASAPTARVNASRFVQAGTSTTFRGGGFSPGETVMFQVTRVDGTAVTGANHTPTSVSADPGGAVSATWLACATDCVGELLQIEATGQASGKVGRAYFRDVPGAPQSGTGMNATNSGRTPGNTPTITGAGFQHGSTAAVPGGTSKAIVNDTPNPPTFERVKSFGSKSPGAYPFDKVVQGADGALYGTTYQGGIFGAGTVYKVNPDGSGFTVLKDFDYGTTGVNPSSRLAQGPDGVLYGTTVSGGQGGFGTVFKLNPDGSGFTVLKSFDLFGNPANGAEPFGGVIRGTDGALYGTAEAGGGNNAGVVYKLNTDGSGFAVLKSFSGGADGFSPIAGLLQGTGGVLYGAAYGGGSFGYGTVFKLATNGSGFAVLKNFDMPTTGGNPLRALIQGTDGALYGTAIIGGSGGTGTVFKLSPDGSGFAVLKSFDGGADGGSPLPSLTQGTDGALYAPTDSGGSFGYGTVFKLNPDGSGFAVVLNLDFRAGGGQNGLIQGTDGALYGTAGNGGFTQEGALFKLNPDGTGFSVLKIFAFGPDISAEGGYPRAGLLQGTDGALYGTTAGGGNIGAGTVFKMNPDGSSLTVLADLDFYSTGGPPLGQLVQGMDGALYGTNEQGGSSGFGTAFRLNRDGTGFTVLHDFDYDNSGGYLEGGLARGADGALYGTAAFGGSFGDGTVFKLNPDGSGFTVLKNLKSSTGVNPYGGLVQGTDGALYGTASGGGGGYGTVFKLNPDGSGFTVLKNFASPTGAYPYGTLVQGMDGGLYGVTVGGGNFGYGTVFRLNPDGSGFVVLKDLDFYVTGANPNAGLVQGTDGTLYGTTYQGGDSNFGTVFKLNPDGTGFAVLEMFGGDGVDGAYPMAALVQGTDGNVYGTTNQGGDVFAGTVFRLVFPTVAPDLCAGVTCAASDPCHVGGTCNPGTGVCSNPAKADGTSCNDGNACTQTDTCQAGTCTGSNPVTCTALDPCHVGGTCNPGTGVCSNPAKADGTSCNDGNACTQTDTCQAGTCTGSNDSWSGMLQPVNTDGSSVFKLGSTIAAKFKLTGACAGNANLIATIYFYQTSGIEGPVNEATSTSAADTGTTFRYSASDDQYIYNLGTKGLNQGTWQLGVDLHDGVGIRTLPVGLRK
jgi:uncharacterized repeat protein (TIGR03803 family)